MNSGLLLKKNDSSKEFGERWIWTAVETKTRLLIGFNIGDRTMEYANLIVCKVRDAIAGKAPMFTSDELVHYKSALILAFGKVITPEPTGRPGRPREPYVELPIDIDYATVHKERQGGTVVKVTRQQVLGNSMRMQARLAEGPSTTINTAFVERVNLDLRLWNAHLARKSPTFAKSERHLNAKFAICAASYNFIRPHESLSRRDDRTFVPTTPAMAASVLVTPWKTRDLILATVCQS